MDLQGSIALVTGGAQRVGRAITMGLARAGVDVFVHYNSSAGPAEETANDVRALGVRAATGAADLGDPDGAPALIAQVAEALGAPTVLINSASGFPGDTIRDVTTDAWLQTHRLTLMSPVFLTQAFAEVIPEDVHGAVVNVTDVRTATPYADRFSYIVAKGGLDTFTKAAAVALAPNIRVNAVALGVVLPPPHEGEEYLARLAEALPLERPGGTEPVVQAVLHLLENHFVTGEIVRLDGGAHLT